MGAALNEYADKVITFGKKAITRNTETDEHGDVDKINEVWK